MLVWNQIIVWLMVKRKDYQWVEGMANLSRGNGVNATEPATVGSITGKVNGKLGHKI